MGNNPDLKATSPRTMRRRARRFGHRRAAIVLEFVVVLPIMVIMLVGIVRFGVYYANMQQVALAARVGAEEASQTGGLPTSDGGAVPANVLIAVSQQLQTAGIDYCRIRLEHNVGGDQVVLFSPSQGTCQGGPDQKLGGAAPPRDYVRLTVTVALSEVMPDTIGCFCFNRTGPRKTAFVTTVFRHEL